MDPVQAITLYQPTLQAIATRLLGCRADAEDIVQETFIKWLNAEREKINNTKAYLIRAVTNNCLNHLQALRKKKEQCLDAFQWPDFIDRIRESEFSHDVEIQLTRAFHLIQNRLEPLERAVFVLKEAFGFDYKALQQLLDKKQEHCRQLFCRARRKLEAGKAPLAKEVSEKPGLLQAFRAACDVGNAGDLVAQLRQDITAALSRKKN